MSYLFFYQSSFYAGKGGRGVTLRAHACQQRCSSGPGRTQGDAPTPFSNSSHNGYIIKSGMNPFADQQTDLTMGIRRILDAGNSIIIDQRLNGAIFQD
jgi:hypothetical protein